MPDLADRLSDPPEHVLSFREFLEYLRKQGFTHIDGISINGMIKLVKAAPALEDWLPVITYWRPIGGGENLVRLCLMSPAGFLAKTVIERKRRANYATPDNQNSENDVASRRPRDQVDG